MTRKVNIGPVTHFLASIRANKTQYHALLAEAVDNSFDYGAHNISIILNEGQISIADDGTGVSRDRWEALVQLGNHMPTNTTALGRYGVGIKYQAISAGDTFHVSSRSRPDGLMRLTVDWKKILSSGSWDIDEPAWSTLTPASGTGTTIRIGELHSKPQQRDLDRCRSELSQMFYPAIRSGKSIQFNGEHIVVPPDPDLIDPVEAVFEIGPHKGAWVRAGMLADRKSRAQGIQISYKHRVIRPRSPFGCGDFSINGIFGRVDLSGKWGLTTFKDDIKDHDEKELEQRVFELILPLLERCRSASLTANVHDMRERLNTALPSELAAVRPKKAQELNRQGEKKKKTGRAPEAPESQSGPARDRRPKNGLMIDFLPSFEDDGYGRFEPGRPSRIILAEDNPHIMRLLRQRDRDAAQRELYLVAMALYLQAPQMELPFEGGFGMQYWRLFERQNLKLDEAEAA